MIRMNELYLARPGLIQVSLLLTRGVPVAAKLMPFEFETKEIVSRVSLCSSPTDSTSRRLGKTCEKALFSNPSKSGQTRTRCFLRFVRARHAGKGPADTLRCLRLGHVSLLPARSIAVRRRAERWRRSA